MFTSKFRNSMTSQAGHVEAKICQGRIVNINLVKWTVDVVAQFDRKRYFNIQVSSPYLHHANGEGIYVMPEVNATVMVCMPSDDTPPFVMCFVMPTETVDTSTDDAPMGTTSHAQPAVNPTGASFAAGRQANPGDIWLRTRDNNFVILRRGGVLQVGSTPLAQRIYIPLNNQVMDVSENYEHQNSGGAMTWGLQEGPSKQIYPTQFMQTFRVFAENQYADVRITVGDVTNPLGDPDGGAAAAAVGLGQNNNATTASNCILYEVAVSPQGFNANTGEPNAGAVSGSVMRFAFDRQSNALIRMSGNFSHQVMGSYTLSVVEDIIIESTAGSLYLNAQSGATIDGGPSTTIKGTVVRLGVGQSGVARIGDFVRVLFTPANAPPLMAAAPIPVVGLPSVPLSIAPGTPIALSGIVWGSITTGNQGVLA
jgi:hypothetical protein